MVLRKGSFSQSGTSIMSKTNFAYYLMNNYFRLPPNQRTSPYYIKVLHMYHRLSTSALSYPGDFSPKYWPEKDHKCTVSKYRKNIEHKYDIGL
jgi:hypothetical protein